LNILQYETRREPIYEEKNVTETVTPESGQSNASFEQITLQNVTVDYELVRH